MTGSSPADHPGQRVTGGPGESATPATGYSGLHPALSGVRSIRAVVAHPDDESFGLGAVISTLVDAGLEVSVLCLTAGEASTLGTAVDLPHLRSGELHAAAAVLGVDAHLWDLADGSLADLPREELERVVERNLGSVDAVLALEPGGVTGHPDHRAASKAAAAVASRHGLPILEWGLPASLARRLSGEFGAPLHGLATSVDNVDLRVNRTRQRAAIAAHRSQQPDNPLLSRRLALQGDREIIRVRPAPYPARLARFVGAVGPLLGRDASPPERRRTLELLAALAAGEWNPGLLAVPDSPPGRYSVACLHDDPAGWGLAAVILPARACTPPHDHAGWGAAVTVTGIERNVRYRGTCPDDLEAIDAQLAPPGGGYLFAAGDVHQACDGGGLGSVSLHLLTAGGSESRQHCREPRRPREAEGVGVTD